MLLRAYPLLCTDSKRAMLRTTGKFGKAYQYSPRGNLLTRIGKQLGLSLDGAYQLLMEEREYLLNQQK